MTSEHNAAIKMAQKLLRTRAASFPQIELPGGYQNIGPDPRAAAYTAAANELEALIVDIGDPPARHSTGLRPA